MEARRRGKASRETHRCGTVLLVNRLRQTAAARMILFVQTNLLSALFVVVVLLFSPAVLADDMQKYLSETQKLIKEGKHEEALDRCLWFHQHALEHAPSMYGVRLSFALSYWKRLGEAYPPALVALQKIRDDDTGLIADGKGTKALFHDVAAINRTLREPGKTVELFQKLDQKQDPLAKPGWNLAKEAALQMKAYDLIKKYMPDLVAEFATIKAAYERDVAMYGKRNFGAQFKTYNENSFIEKTTQLIELALATDNPTAAKAIQEKALATLDDPRLRNAIPVK